jgi:hypothetical protein
MYLRHTLRKIRPMNSNTETKKVLIGWNEINPVQLLTGNNQMLVTQDHLQIVQQAVNVKNARQPFINPTDVISEPGPELTQYINQFWQQPNMQAFIQEGWTIKIADLKKVCTIQPSVEMIKSVERVQNVAPENLVSLATVTLPFQAPTNLQVAFDPVKNAWLFSSPNPNLRVTGNFANSGLFGFAVSLANSFVQVVKCQNRFFMRDGHHRAFGLLSRNIFKVPVIYREYNSFNEMMIPPGLFPTEILLSERPPMLMDYLDDNVSSIGEFPLSTKVIVIQALEVNTLV